MALKSLRRDPDRWLMTRLCHSGHASHECSTRLALKDMAGDLQQRPTHQVGDLDVRHAISVRKRQGQRVRTFPFVRRAWRSCLHGPHAGPTRGEMRHHQHDAMSVLSGRSHKDAILCIVRPLFVAGVGVLSRGQDFADLVHRILVNEGRHSLATASSGMGMLYGTLYARVVNRTCFSADEIRLLMRSVSDPRLPAYFLDGTSFVAVERMSAAERASETDTLRAAHRLVYMAADILRRIETALGDGRIDHREAPGIEAELDGAERLILGLRAQIRPGAPGAEAGE